MKLSHQDKIQAYLKSLPNDRKQALMGLRTVLRENLPQDFEETFQYGMISYVVPHEIYPQGYHVNPDDPLPFISIGNQAKHIAMYHYGLYENHDLSQWFKDAYQAISPHKIDMGKSCVRFKWMDEIPFDLVKILATKISVKTWIKDYEKGRNL